MDASESNVVVGRVVPSQTAQMEPVRVDSTPVQTLSLAIERGVDPDVLKRMLEVQERWEANEARKAYVKAMTAFKRTAPAVLRKDASVDFSTSKGRTHYTHATLGSIINQITEKLSEHGLSVSWSSEQSADGVAVTCHVTHERGHSESVKLTAPPDDSGNKNRIQMVGSTVTYLQRYTLLAALGLATADQDDDGISAGVRRGVDDAQKSNADLQAASADEGGGAAEGPGRVATGLAQQPAASSLDDNPPLCPKCGFPMDDKREYRRKAEQEIAAGTRKRDKDGKPVAPPAAWKCSQGHWDKVTGKSSGCQAVVWPHDPLEDAKYMASTYGQRWAASQIADGMGDKMEAEAASSAPDAEALLPVDEGQKKRIEELRCVLQKSSQWVAKQCEGLHLPAFKDMHSPDADKLIKHLEALVAAKSERDPAECPACPKCGMETESAGTPWKYRCLTCKHEFKE